jgi:ring-1,2-phenylacetyl-CoA epoxidase subunit PaaD
VVNGAAAPAGDVVRAIHDVADPELCVVTIGDLGIVRDVRVPQTAEAAVEVDLTPTYIGCPAVEAIIDAVTEAVRAKGYPDVRVRSALSPAWSTDWITPDGRRKLHAAGIAPPGPAQDGPIGLAMPPDCPRCGSALTRELGLFGSTLCLSRYVCSSCREPFEYVKSI